MPVLFKARPVLGFVHCVRDQKCCFSLGPIVFSSERAFAIATKVPLREYVKIFAKNWENRGDFCAAGSGQTWPVYSLEAT